MAFLECLQHSCNVSGPWSSEALDVLQKFPLVTIERFMGQHTQCFAKHKSQWGPPGGWLNHTHGNPACPTSGTLISGCNCTVEEAPPGLTTDARNLYVEDNTLAALKQIKQRNPNVSTIFYHDSARMWTNDQPDKWGRVPKQSTRYWNPTVYKADNELLKNHPDWLLHNSSGQFVYDSYAK